MDTFDFGWDPRKVAKAIKFLEDSLRDDGIDPGRSVLHLPPRKPKPAKPRKRKPSKAA